MNRRLTLKSLMLRAMNRVMPTCEDVTQLVSYSMDQEIPVSDRIRIRVHLWFCRWCSMFQEQLRFIRNLTREGAARPEHVDSGIAGRLKPEAKAKLQAAIHR